MIIVSSFFFGKMNLSKNKYFMFVFIWVDPDAFEVHEVLKYKLTMHFHILDEKKKTITQYYKTLIAYYWKLSDSLTTAR